MVSYLAETHPALAFEWDYAKNEGIQISKIVAGSHKKVWWLCPEGHSWQANPLARKEGVNCPYCSGRIPLIGVNDIPTLYPHLLSEWNGSRNSGLNLTDLTAGSGKRVWWVCSKGHEWDAVISSRTLAGRGCPVCSGNVVLAGFNDFATTKPELAKQWHPTKNGALAPSDVSSGSNKRVWWQCEEGHEWQTSVNNRTNGSTCFYCSYASGKRQIGFSTPQVGINDLATKYPFLASQWNYIKNGDMTPEMFKQGSDQRVWWICEKGHEWETKICDRSHYQTGCPVCSLTIFVSKAEQAISDFISTLGLRVEQSNRNVLKGLEIDIWVPEKNIGIEYNGVYWHNSDRKTAKYHYNKWRAAERNNIQLIQIWEDDWVRKPDLIKSMLAHKLGLSNMPRVSARETIVTVLAKNEAEKFLETNHIQGFASGSYYVGLKSKIDGALVAVVVLKKESSPRRNVLNIIRYATSANVVGGFTKLIAYAERNFPVESFITFSDHMVSDGRLYSTNGFVADKELPPDYMYVIKDVRKHKFGYRLAKFKNDPKLKWVDGLNEAELAEANGLKRVWDAGKTRWVKQVERSDKEILKEK